MVIMFIFNFYLTDISAEQQEYKELAAKFVEEKMIPKAAHYDKTGEVHLDNKEGHRVRVVKGRGTDLLAGGDGCSIICQ